ARGCGRPPVLCSPLQVQSVGARRHFWPRAACAPVGTRLESVWQPMTSSGEAGTSPHRPRTFWNAGPAVEWAVLVGLAWLFVRNGFLVGWASLNTDFPNYYLAGQLFRDGYPMERLNDWIWFQRQKDHAQIQQALVGYIPSTLLSMLMIVPLTSLPQL